MRAARARLARMARITAAMTYAVKEMFYTLQGEGARAGRPAVFVRFAGCNLWSGREQDRAGAICRFCDTNFVGVDGDGGGKYETADDLAAAAVALWPGGGAPYVVCTGGEPLLQIDIAMIAAFHAAGFEIAVETNGAIAAPAGIDWVCVSPKAGAQLVQVEGDELKLVFPQHGADPALYQALPFKYFFLQPMDGPALRANTEAAVSYCLANPRWRLSLQTHKVLGLR
jgi:7-carboxy-7-deazaguanine synthase (Cx14CxxC type)